MYRGLWAALLVLIWSAPALAHTMQMTRVQATLEPSGRVQVRIDADLTLLLGSAERYYALSQQSRPQQAEIIGQLLPTILQTVQLAVGTQSLPLRFMDFAIAQASRADYLDGSISKPSTLTFQTELPADAAPLRLIVSVGALIDYPVAYTIQVPSVSGLPE